MAITYDSKYQLQVVDLAKGEGQAMIDGLNETLGTSPSGAAVPNDAQLAAFFFHQQVMYPPEQFTFPDGHQVFASPWILALEFTENGNEWLGKFDRFLKKNPA